MKKKIPKKKKGETETERVPYNFEFRGLIGYGYLYLETKTHAYINVLNQEERRNKPLFFFSLWCSQRRYHLSYSSTLPPPFEAAIDRPYTVIKKISINGYNILQLICSRSIDRYSSHSTQERLALVQTAYTTYSTVMTGFTVFMGGACSASVVSSSDISLAQSKDIWSVATATAFTGSGSKPP